MIDEALLKNYILESAKEVFETMVFLPLEEIEQRQDKPDPSTSLICSITFTGQLRGCFSMRCYPEGAERIAKSMLMAEPGDLMKETEIYDALGETVNMILGGIKARLSSIVSDMRLSIPSTVKGKGIRLMLGKSAKNATLTALSEDNTSKFTMLYAG